MQIVRLHIHHSRYPSATRRVVPHPYRFPSDLGPEAGHVLCAAILTEFVPALDPVDREGLDLLLSTLETRPRPARALRHRVQHDTHGLDENLHSLSGSRAAVCRCGSTVTRRAASRRGSRRTVLPGGPTQAGSAADRPPRAPVPGRWVHRPRRLARLLTAGDGASRLGARENVDVGRTGDRSRRRSGCRGESCRRTHGFQVSHAGGAPGSRRRARRGRRAACTAPGCAGHIDRHRWLNQELP